MATQNAAAVTAALGGGGGDASPSLNGGGNGALASPAPVEESAAVAAADAQNAATSVPLAGGGAGFSLDDGGGANGALASPPVEESAAAVAAAQNAAATTTATEGGDEAQHLLREVAELKAALAAAEKKAAAAEARAAELGALLRQAGADQKIAPALPLAIVFDKLLEPKILSAVDVRELGCVCSELSLCVRQFWAKAEAHPGSQRRLLFVKDGGGGASLEEEDEEEQWLVGGDWSPAYEKGKTVITRALKDEPCSCCGCEYDRDKPLSYTYPYPFDGEWPALEPRTHLFGVDWRESLDQRPWGGTVLCRGCYRRASHNPPHHSREERFRLGDWYTMVKRYDTPLPRSILECAVRKVRTMSPSSKPVFDHASPHASVLHAANFALALKTPRELHVHWRRYAR